MNFETVERCGRTYVIKNGVESAGFIKRDYGGNWGRWDFVLVAVGSRGDGLAAIAAGMDDWYTVPQAAARLAEMGKVTAAPERHTMYRWLRAGRFPGAIRIPGMRGRGHPWRIPGKALREFNRGGEEKCG